MADWPRLITGVAAALALVGMGGGLYEFLVVDPVWPQKPELIQPLRGGVSRRRFWIPAHLLFEGARLGAPESAAAAPRSRDLRRDAGCLRHCGATHCLVGLRSLAAISYAACLQGRRRGIEAPGGTAMGRRPKLLAVVLLVGLVSQLAHAQQGPTQAELDAAASTA